LALTVSSHVHHTAASNWFAASDFPFATCSITQGAMLRLHMVLKASGSFEAAQAVLLRLIDHPRHRFWVDDLGYGALRSRGIQGHRQVTDAYLVALAARHKGRLATFDKGLAALHPKVADLIA
jgi:predicted nucleic acid-binding protein